MLDWFMGVDVDDDERSVSFLCFGEWGLGLSILF